MYKGKLIRLLADFQWKICRPEGSGMNTQSTEKKNLPTKNNQQECDSE